ncbi:hypothetical protein LCGC14_2271640 [marine sediment metagenome]|uniref:4-(cytidine 5'-diphospho)-2-C-methyl-D-erythritol kinase n=1 Tax=marine sediment metagenome TaxID=412755 RepID=A0A0F9F9B1_9ZZZZ
MTGEPWDKKIWTPRPEMVPTAEGELTCAAPAKLNLSLQVLGVRDDGLHDIDSIVAKVTLCDELVLRRRDDGQVRLTCCGYDCGPAEDNLVCRAGRLLAEAAGTPPPGADISLVKAIPPGSGLGGGSSDAAAALKGLSVLWNLELGESELADLAGRLGSDVPLFLGPPASRVRGRGLRVDAIDLTPFVALVYLPDLHCATSEVYAAWDAIHAGRSARRGPGDGSSKWSAMVSAGQIRGPASSWRGELVNDLSEAAVQVRPALADIRTRLGDATAMPVHITGSGSAVFMLFDSVERLLEARAALPADMRPCCRAVMLNPW